MSTILPKQIGFTVAGNTNGIGGTASQSQVIIGKDITLSWDCVGFGGQGRPDPVENVILNLTIITNAPNGPQKLGQISFNASDIAAIISNNTNAPTPILMKLTEVDVCSNGTPMKMIVLASTPYAPSANDPAPS